MMHPRPKANLAHLAWPVRLTMWGMWAEQVARAFWPLWTVVALALVPLILGWHEIVPLEVLWGGGVVAALGLLASLIWGLRKLQIPQREEAVRRVDARLPGRPIAAVTDSQAIGASDPASAAVWREHLDRMADKTREARAVEPDLRVSSRDPYGLRHIALLFLACAFLFGAFWRVGDVAEVPAGEGLALATGPVWEGWIEPPDYTGKPSLYLADIPPGDVDVPQGSRVTLRLYGEVGALTVEETISGRTSELGAASDSQHTFDVTQSGRLEIAGAEDAAWTVNVLADTAPSVEILGPPEADAEGVMSLPFGATDDHAIMAGQATITLDLPLVERRHGLIIDPDPQEALVVDLPMPFSGDRSEFEELLVDDFSEHPLANMPVLLTLTVSDALGQEGMSATEPMVLPGRRFFQPVAKAVIEQRRDLMWSTANAPRILQIMRAISHRPEDIFTGETVYLRFGEIQRNLENAIEGNGVTPEIQAELVDAMWELALQLEEGSLADARERLARAQERLEEAMRNGASDEEIAELMQELREATDDYMQLLADETEFADQRDQPDQNGEGQEITGNQIQEMMDEIQRLMEEGQMAEAMELMEQLNELLENLQITQGDGSGEGGPQTPGQRSMEELQDNLRDQQELSDEAFRELQEQFNNGGPQDGQDPGQQQGQQDGQQPGQQGQQPNGQSGQGQSPGDQPQGQGQQNDQGQGGEGNTEGGGSNFPPGAEGSLAERQEALRRELDRLRDNLPALSGEEAEIARRALEDAERAMEEAEEALRGNDLAEALDRQAEAMDAMREGLRSLGRALAENEQDVEPGDRQADGGSAQGQTDGQSRDPLGRQLGTTGEYGTEENLLQGPDVYRRAEELLEELRRRSAEQERPEEELDYLRRLLDQF